MPRSTAATALAFAVLCAACATTAPRAAQVAAPAPAPVPAAAPSSLPLGYRPALEIRWVTDSAEYVAATLQAFRAATARIEQEASRYKPGTWAVIVDADETILSNAVYQAERAAIGQGYTTDSWAAWVRRREARPIAGAAEFLARTRQLGGRIAVVTNRLASECDDTRAVFAMYNLAFDAMLCRPEQTPSDKNPRFDAVAKGQTPAGSQPLTVVAFMGDNILDFPGLSQDARGAATSALEDFGVRYFMLPNPMYGSWQ
jgi:5'-nucleotidase (lipoprotein e(P4) family)